MVHVLRPLRMRNHRRRDWLPHGSGEVPPFKRYSHFMRKFVATVARYGGFESHVMGSHAA